MITKFKIYKQLLEEQNNHKFEIADILSLLWDEDSRTGADYYDLYPNYSNKYDKDESYHFNSKKNAFNEAKSIQGMFDSFPDKFAIYRAIYLKKIEDLRPPDYLGECWTFDLESAKEFATHNRSNYIISGYVEHDNIDWNESLLRYFHNNFGDADDENEVVVIYTELIEKLQVVPIKEAKELEPNPIFTRIPNNLEESIKNYNEKPLLKYIADNI